MANSGQWATIVACFSINFVLLGTARLASLYYVELLQRFNTSRERASLPFVSAYSMALTLGPIFGYFATRYGLQEITLVGCILAAFGTGICFFAEHIITVTVFWGLIFGIGYGSGSAFLPSITNLHIPRKHQTKANAIASSGATVGTIILPYFVEYFIENYGVSGSFLVLSALMLNAVPAAMLMLLRSENLKPIEVNAQEKELLNNFIENQVPKSECDLIGLNKLASEDNHTSETINAVPAAAMLMLLRSENPKPIEVDANEKELLHIFIENQVPKSECDLIGFNKLVSGNNHTSGTKFETRDLAEKQDSVKEKSFISSHEAHVIAHMIASSGNELASEKYVKTQNTSNMYEKLNPLEEIFTLVALHQSTTEHIPFKKEDNSQDETNVSLLSLDQNEPQLSTRQNKYDNGKTITGIPGVISAVPSWIPPLKTKKCPMSSRQDTKNNVALRSFRILLNKTFITIAIYQSTFMWIVTTFWTIMIDLLIDSDIDKPVAINFFTVSMILDIFGRLCLGYINDKRWVTFTNFGVFVYISMGTSFIAITLPFGQVFLVFATLMTAFFSAGMLPYLPGAIEEFIENDQKSMAMASKTMFALPLSFATSPLIGYFREVKGSYHGLLYVLAAASYVCALLVFAVPRLHSKHKSNTNKSDLLS